MADLFGYNRSGTALGQVASSEFAAVFVGGAGGAGAAGGAKIALVQSANMTYQQQIDEVKAIGDSNIYWLPGRPSGNITVAKLVGTGNFFSGWNSGQCGQINALSVNLAGGECGFSGGGSLSFTGAVVESFALEMNSQNQTITETATIKVATISR